MRKSILIACVAALFMSGCTDPLVDQSMNALYDWIDGFEQCPDVDSAVEAHMAAFPALAQNLRDVLANKTLAERTDAMVALKQYMREKFPEIVYDFSDAQLVYIVFGIKRTIWEIEGATDTFEMGQMQAGLPDGRMPTQEEWRHFFSQLHDLNGNGIPDANDPAMQGVRDDLHGLPLGFSPYDHSGVLRHSAGAVDDAAAYHGLVPVDQEIPVFTSVAEAAEFLASNPYRQVYVDRPEAQEKALIDTDKDGLTDSSETLGWNVSVFSGYDVETSYHVTSDPLVADTDGDGLLDSEEQQHRLDPGNPDTDADGLSDYDEIHVYGTNANSVDSDSDCRGFAVVSSIGLVVWEYADCDPQMFDAAELFNQDSPASPTLSDTDGDSRSDRTERYQNRPPRVSDVPQFKVEIVGAPQLIILDKQGDTYQEMDQHLESNTTTHAESTTNSWNIGGKMNLGSSAGLSKKDGFSMSKSAGLELSGGYSHSKQTTNTTSNTVQDMHQTVQTHSQDISGYTLKTQVRVTNVSNTPLTATVTSLVINCVYQIPNGTDSPGIGYLEMSPSTEMSGWGLSPGGSTTLTVSGTEHSASGAAEITNVIGSGAPITFTVARCAMKATNGSAVGDIMENVEQAASTITLDFGPYYPNEDDTPANHKPKVYYVAANIPRVIDGEVTMGLSLVEALSLVGVTDYVMSEDGGLKQLQGWPSDPEAHPRGAWVIASSSESLVPNPANPGSFTYDRFDTIWLAGANPKISSAPDFIQILWMDDQDGDGLTDATEASYGTDPNAADTDGDGLSDYDEVNGVKWETSGSQVFHTSPLRADTDGDGLSDYDEIHQWHSNPLESTQLGFHSLLGSSSGNRTNIQTSLPVDKTEVLPGDFDGDGYGDFIRQEKGDWDNKDKTIQVFYGDGDGHFESVKLTLDNASSLDPYQHFRFDPGCVLKVGDFNNDGLDDFLRQEQNGWDNYKDANIELYLGTMGKAGVFHKASFSFSGPRSDWAHDMRHDKGAHLHAHDFDGDGFTDLLRQEHGSWDDDEETAIIYYASIKDAKVHFEGKLVTASGTLNKPQHDLRYDLGAKLFFGDFDGDGKCDIFRQAWNDWDDNDVDNANIFFATSGQGHFETVAVTSTGVLDNPQHQLRHDDGAYVRTGDFNGDGKCDFLRQEHGSWGKNANNNFSMYLGNGDGSFVSSFVNTTGRFTYPFTDLSGNLCELITLDINGDGRCDFMRRGIDSADNTSDTISFFLAGYGK